MMLTGAMLDTMTAPELGQWLAHDLVAPQAKSSFVAALLGKRTPKGSWPFRASLEPAVLDYSVDSLAAVDRHLDELHNSLPFGDDGKDIESLGSEQLRSVIPTIGCYVGEVLRRNGASDHVWTYHFDYIERYPDKVNLLGEDPSPSTILMLTTDGGDFILPLGKVCKFLQDGPADSTIGLAQLVQNRPAATA